MSLSPFGFDQSATDWVVSVRAEPWDSFWQFVTVFGDPLTMTLVMIGVVVLAWLGNRIDLAALIVFGSLSSSAVLWILKHLFGRARPPVSERLLEVGGMSFPSGHTLNSTVIYGLTAVICFQLYPWVRANRAVLAIAPVLIVGIGLSRVYLAAHWLSDVLVGWLVGIVWLGVCLAIHQGVSRWIRERTESQPESR